MERAAHFWMVSFVVESMPLSLLNVGPFRFGPNSLMMSMLGMKRGKTAREWIRQLVVCTPSRKFERFGTKDCPQRKEIVAH